MASPADPVEPHGLVDPHGPVDVVFVGQLPPPRHGQAIANQAIASGRYERLRVTCVPMRFSDDVASTGRVSLTKLLRLPLLVLAVVKVRLRGHGNVLLYTVGARNRVGVVRDVLVLPLIRPLFRRTVLVVHTAGLRHLYDTRGLTLLARLAYGRADVVIHSDERVAGGDDRLPSPRALAFLPPGIADPGVDVSRPDPEHDDRRPVILFVGNLYPSKGTHHLVRAAGLLATRGHDFEVRFAGASPTPTAADDLLALARIRGVADRVTLLGPLASSDVWEELHRADVFCFPTRYEAESWGLVILEAMAAARPVVSTHWRAVPAMVDDGVTGFLVEPDDDVALADRLDALLTDPDAARAMGLAGRARYEANFTIERFEAGLEQIVLGVA
jgi:glycosyltransferase involved in cell wall biosynthesis